MKLFDTSTAPSRLQRNSDDFAEVRWITDSDNDHPVLMLNMNRYMPDSGFPDRGAYSRRRLRERTHFFWWKLTQQMRIDL
jgi:hypothetical protein